MNKFIKEASACLIILYCLPTTSAGGPPVRLATDLVEHTDRIWIDGKISQLTLDYHGEIIENTQYVPVCSRKPHFSWQVEDDRKNVMQTAYRIQLGSSRRAVENGAADMWDSGKLPGSNSISVEYGGKELEPDSVYFWRVMTWNNGDPQEWSSIRAFRMADSLDDYRCPAYPIVKSEQTPVHETYLSDDILFADFGQAAFGQLNITVSSNRKDTLTVSIGECLKNGRLDPEPGGSRRFLSQKTALLPGRYTYIIKIPADKRNTGRSAVKMPGSIGEVYPFRYCEVEGRSIKDKSVTVSRQTVHYPFDDSASVFSCPDTALQQIWEMCRYSMKATSFAGLYVDGDRERIPYEGDAVINQLSHYASDREFTLARRSHEYLLTHATWPAEWVLQSISMAWADYMYTGDKRSLTNFYEILKKKTLSELAGDDGLLHTAPERQSPEFKTSIHLVFGDKIENLVDWPAGERDGYEMTDTCAVLNAYYYQALVLMSGIADAAGRKDDAKKYRKDADALAMNFRKTFFDKESGLFNDGKNSSHKSLHGNMFPLAFGLVAEDDRERIVDFIRSRGMACSVYGAQFLLEALYNAGADDYALELLTSRSERSWYNMIRSGSTVSLEAWDDRFKPNQDWNHAWGAVPANIIVRKLMGVEPAEPGFARIRIRPQPGTLREAYLKLPTIRGDVEMSFINSPDAFSMDICIPANTLADIYLPWKDETGRFTLTVDGDRQDNAVVENGFIKIPDTGSGMKKIVLVRKNPASALGEKRGGSVY